MNWLQRALTLFLISAVVGTLRAWRARASTDLGTLSRVLRYPTVFRAVAWFCVVGLGLFTLLATGIGNHGLAAPTWIVVFFGTFALVSVALVVEFSFRTVRWNAHALVSISPWSRTKDLLWGDVTRVTYSVANRWFVFSSNSGETVTVHSWMGGVAEFLRHARAALPERIWKDAIEGFRVHGGLDAHYFRFHGSDGGDVDVSASDLRRILSRYVEAEWAEPGPLSQLIEAGVDHGFAAELIPAAARLVVLENESERSLLVSANV